MSFFNSSVFLRVLFFVLVQRSADTDVTFPFPHHSYPVDLAIWMR